MIVNFRRSFLRVYHPLHLLRGSRLPVHWQQPRLRPRTAHPHRRATDSRQLSLLSFDPENGVISDKLSRTPKPDRKAIYGWHKPDGTPIIGTILQALNKQHYWHTIAAK